MSTTILHVERDFLLRSILYEKIPLTYYKNHVNYILELYNISRELVVLKQKNPIKNLNAGSTLPLMFDFHGQIITFKIRADFLKEDFIICKKPALAYKSLTRSFLRIPPPENLKVEFHFKGERYDLAFPIASGFEDDDLQEVFKGKTNSDLPAMIASMAEQIKQVANGYKLVTFKGREPRTTEEMAITQTGKALYLPSTEGPFPQKDPYPKKRIITEELFKRFLANVLTDNTMLSLNNFIHNFLRMKREQHVFSEAYVPILFQNYVVGYIYIWNDNKQGVDLGLEILEKIFDLAKIMCYSLKINGHFEKVKLIEKTFTGKIVDVSATGLLFSYRNVEFDLTLQKRDTLDVKLMTPDRTINTLAIVVRRYKERATNFVGCKFVDLPPEDIEFMSDVLYGKVFDKEGEDNFVISIENMTNA